MEPKKSKNLTEEVIVHPNHLTRCARITGVWVLLCAHPFLDRRVTETSPNPQKVYHSPRSKKSAAPPSPAIRGMKSLDTSTKDH